MGLKDPFLIKKRSVSRFQDYVYVYALQNKQKKRGYFYVNVEKAHST